MKWVAEESPIGAIGLAVESGAVAGVSFGAPAEVVTAEQLTPAEGAIIDAARVEFAEYFAGQRLTFDVATSVVRGSEFERAVWAQIATIPYGETLSYGAIARAVGQPGGAQAVGLACHRNPLPIIIACHRVIGSDGKLVGFGGGLRRKTWLLQLEARIHIEKTMAS